MKRSNPHKEPQIKSLHTHKEPQIKYSSYKNQKPIKIIDDRKYIPNKPHMGDDVLTELHELRRGDRTMIIDISDSTTFKALQDNNLSLDDFTQGVKALSLFCHRSDFKNNMEKNKILADRFTCFTKLFYEFVNDTHYFEKWINELKLSNPKVLPSLVSDWMFSFMSLAQASNHKIPAHVIIFLLEQMETDIIGDKFDWKYVSQTISSLGEIFMVGGCVGTISSQCVNSLLKKLDSRERDEKSIYKILDGLAKAGEEGILVDPINIDNLMGPDYINKLACHSHNNPVSNNEVLNVKKPKLNLIEDSVFFNLKFNTLKIADIIGNLGRLAGTGLLKTSVDNKAIHFLLKNFSRDLVSTNIASIARLITGFSKMVEAKLVIPYPFALALKSISTKFNALVKLSDKLEDNNRYIIMVIISEAKLADAGLPIHFYQINFLITRYIASLKFSFTLKDINHGVPGVIIALEKLNNVIKIQSLLEKFIKNISMATATNTAVILHTLGKLAEKGILNSNFDFFIETLINKFINELSKSNFRDLCMVIVSIEKFLESGINIKSADKTMSILLEKFFLNFHSVSEEGMPMVATVLGRLADTGKLAAHLNNENNKIKVDLLDYLNRFINILNYKGSLIGCIHYILVVIKVLLASDVNTSELLQRFINIILNHFNLGQSRTADIIHWLVRFGDKQAEYTKLFEYCIKRLTFFSIRTFYPEILRKLRADIPLLAHMPSWQLALRNAIDPYYQLASMSHNKPILQLPCLSDTKMLSFLPQIDNEEVSGQLRLDETKTPNQLSINNNIFINNNVPINNNEYITEEKIDLEFQLEVPKLPSVNATVSENDTRYLLRGNVKFTPNLSNLTFDHLQYDVKNENSIKQLMKDNKGAFTYYFKEQDLPENINLTIAKTFVIGGQYGVFAKTNINPHESENPKPLGYYFGDRLTGNEAHKMLEQQSSDNQNAFLMQMIDSEENLTILDAGSKRNWTAFVNHSPTPNLGMAYFYDEDGVLQMGYFVIRPIKCGDQLTINYGVHYFEDAFYLHASDNWESYMERYLKNKAYYLDYLYTFNTKIKNDLNLRDGLFLLPSIFLDIENDDIAMLESKMSVAYPLELYAYSVEENTILGPDSEQHLTPFMYACYRQKINCINLLMSSKAIDFDRLTLGTGLSALMFLLLIPPENEVKKKQIEKIAITIFKKMKQPFAVNHQGFNILHYAIKGNYNSLIEVILNRADKSISYFHYDVFTPLIENEKSNQNCDFDFCIQNINTRYDTLKILIKCVFSSKTQLTGDIAGYINQGTCFKLETLQMLKKDQLESLRELLAPYERILRKNTKLLNYFDQNMLPNSHLEIKENTKPIENTKVIFKSNENHDAKKQITTNLPSIRKPTKLNPEKSVSLKSELTDQIDSSLNVLEDLSFIKQIATVKPTEIAKSTSIPKRATTAKSMIQVPSFSRLKSMLFIFDESDSKSMTASKLKPTSEAEPKNRK